jgi:hypothetical protein
MAYPFPSLLWPENLERRRPTTLDDTKQLHRLRVLREAEQSANVTATCRLRSKEAPTESDQGGPVSQGRRVESGECNGGQ